MLLFKSEVVLINKCTYCFATKYIYPNKIKHTVQLYLTACLNPVCVLDVEIQFKEHSVYLAGYSKKRDQKYCV